MEYLKIAASAVCGYLLGSIMFAVIISKVIYGLDVRSQGSGNAGATNVARVFGLGCGLLTFVFDALKTIISMLIGTALAGETGMVAALMACVTGHCFPIFFKFKGGKGVSVGAAVGFAINWRVFLMLLAVFVIMFIVTKRVSACSVAAAVALPVCVLALGYNSMPYILLGFFTAVLVIVMHKENISRLIKGEEAVFKPQKRGNAPRGK